MLAQLTALQVVEMIAYSRIEAKPISDEDAARINLQRLKDKFAPFARKRT